MTESELNLCATQRAPRRLAQRLAGAAPLSIPITRWSNALADELRQRLQTYIYGPAPALSISALSKDRLEAASLPADIERWRAHALIGAQTVAFTLLVMIPRTRVRALILAQVFQRSPSPMARIEHALAGAPAGWADTALSALLGRYIHAPPFAAILAQGFALALFCPGEIVPDCRRAGPERLDACRRDGPAPGALAAWASLASAARKSLAADMRLASTPVVAWGHSRHGKAALLAAACDEGFAGVIAHQSGRFGASMTYGAKGETPHQIARAFPHWFCARFHEHTPATAASEIDQHHLLALIAPRPVLLGNAALDYWADPAASFRAALAASTVYEQAGHRGLSQSEPDRADFSGGLSSFTRAGGHGVNETDWRVFLEFLGAKFASAP